MKYRIGIYIIGTLALLFLAWELHQVFSGRVILPQFFSFGPLTVHYYGITMALAVGGGWWLAARRAKHYGLTFEQVDKLALWLVVGGFVAARLYHVASSWQYYLQYPQDIVKVWHGGLSIFGALIGGFVVLTIFARGCNNSAMPSESLSRGIAPVNSDSSAVAEAMADRSAQSLASIRQSSRSGKTLLLGMTRKRALLSLLDWLAPSVVLGQIIGRFGNFFNYEAFGYPTSLPWKMFVPVMFRPDAFVSARYFHPLFLYEVLGNLVVLSVLLKYSKRVPVGALFFGYLFLYNILRFFLEHLRIDSTFFSNGIRLNAVSSGILCVIGLIGLWYVYSLKTSKTVSVEANKS